MKWTNCLKFVTKIHSVSRKHEFSESSGRYFNLYARNLPEKSNPFFLVTWFTGKFHHVREWWASASPTQGQRKKEHLTINRATQECKISLKLKTQTITSLVPKQRGEHEQHRFRPWRWWNPMFSLRTKGLKKVEQQRTLPFCSMHLRSLQLTPHLTIISQQATETHRRADATVCSKQLSAKKILRHLQRWLLE